ncbi:MAG: hypothetical protein KFF49_12745 [Bacteroidales bacterium]|nr:hypothetical protein [Bacteroidales bacterium]
MKYIKIKSTRDIKLAREIYRYEAKIHKQSISSAIHHFRNQFRTALENTLRDAAAKAMIFGIEKLSGKRR